MTKMSKYLLVMLALLCPMMECFAQGWVSFTNEEKTFTVKMPEQPTATNQKTETGIGDMLLKLYMTSEPKDNEDKLMYMVMTTEYPTSANISSENKEMLAGLFQNALDGGVKNVPEGELISVKDITLGEFPGKEFVMSFMGGEGVIKGRLYMVKNSMYILQAIGKKAQEKDPAIATFLASLKLLKN